MNEFFNKEHKHNAMKASKDTFKGATSTFLFEKKEN